MRPTFETATLLSLLREVLRGHGWLALDTETTRLGPRAEIIEIAIVEPDGRELTMRVWPRGRISRSAAAIHRIDAGQLEGAPKFTEIARVICERLEDRVVLAYNAAFDHQVLRRELERAGLTEPRSRWLCLRDLTTRWAGQSLTLEEAMARFGLEPEQPRHRAAPDARSVARLARVLAAIEV